MPRSGTISGPARSMMLSMLLGYAPSRGFASPQRLHIALLRAPAIDSDSGTTLMAKEPPYNYYDTSGIYLPTGYRRGVISTEPLSGAWTESGDGGAINSNEIQFDTPLMDWGTLSCWALVTGEEAGTIVAYGDLTDPITVLADADVMIVPGGLRLVIEQRGGGL